MSDVIVQVDTLWDGQPARPDETVRVTLRDGGPHLLFLIDAPYHGDPPPEGPAGVFWKLWEHEVVELFILGLADRYLEVEVGPHGHQIVLQLAGERQAVATRLPLAVETEIDGDRWRGTAWIPRSYLPEGADRINVTAIHGVGPARRFLSWAPLPGERPNFHQLAVFRATPIP